MLANIPVQISKTAKSIFASLLLELGDKQHVKIDRGGVCIMPVTIERLMDGIKTPWGVGYFISIAHYHEQNGDLMRDPEVVYLVVDNRGKAGQLDMLGVWPSEFQQDGYLGTYQRLLFFENDELKKFDKKHQKDVAVFTSMWFKNIRYQQKIAPVKEDNTIK